MVSDREMGRKEIDTDELAPLVGLALACSHLLIIIGNWYLLKIPVGVVRIIPRNVVGPS